MARATGITGVLVLPNASEKYDAQNERETRRLIALAMTRLTRWDAISDTPGNVTAIGGLTGAADMVPYFTGLSAMALTSLTPFARTILACASASTMRTALGLGPLAILGVPSDATKFLNGAVSPAFAQVKDSDLSLSNITTNDVSITKHGFTPIAPNDVTKFLRGDGTWAAPVSSGGGGSPAVLTDTTDLAAWFSADAAANTVAANTGQLTVFADLTGNGHAFTPGTGRVQKQYAGLAGSPVALFATGMTAVAGITIPLKGAMTYFAVLKVTSSAAYQNLFKPSLTPAQPNDMHLYWDQPSGKWQVDGAVVGSGVAGTWHTLVVHYYNTGSVMHFKVRQDGAQIQADTASTNGSNPIPGTSGTPVNFGLNLFLDSVANGLKYTSQIAEWGFYAVSKDGTESTLESYLRAKYSTW